MKEEIITITTDEIVGAVMKYKADGYRLVTMTCVDLDEENVDILYHFDKDLEMVHLRCTAAKAEKVPSISPVLFAALLIENEITDQYGVIFDGLVLDFGGKLYLEDEVQTTPFAKFSTVREQ